MLDYRTNIASKNSVLVSYTGNKTATLAQVSPCKVFPQH